ncbi:MULTISPECIES: thioesterase family protein [Cellvibrio]|jgi:acyl-CoA thioester hydrolase|uniref:acyl-CoA thioesterase n=1 Tax=Cellvibrio TaxID=10 RepID=UPI0012447642|nr:MULTISPECIES: thioesterase family protein [Cellvibrio]QEY11350.1 acyl-CoA thioesterase [Cellvibrio sp. KY-YJ-3]
MSNETAVKPFYSCQIPVRWGDMDAYGHVNNTLYFRYFEEARFQWMLEKGLPLKSDTHPVVVTIGCTFLRPIFHPELLRIDVFLSEPGRSSFMVKYLVYTQSHPDTPAAEGYSKVVWVSAVDGKSVPLPDNVRCWFDPQ